MTSIANGKHRSWFSVSAVSVSALALLLSTAGIAAAAPAPKTPDTISFSSANYEVTEGQGSACITVYRSVTKGKSPSVTLLTSDGTATPGTDYTPVDTTVTFTRQQSEASACVPILVDLVTGEQDETVSLSLSTSSRGWTVGTWSEATLTIHEMPVPSAPTDLAAEVMSGSSGPYVHLTWTAPGTGSVDHYSIGSSTTSGGPYTKLGTTTGTSYDVTPAPSVTSYYVVEAVNADTATSAYSDEAVGEGFAPGSGLYWANYSDGTIMAANKDGSGVHPLVTGQANPFGIAVDASHIYWANIGADTIMEANLDGSGPHAITNDQTYPFAIAVDGSNLYWANTGDNTAATGTINVSDLDGSNVTTLVSGQAHPDGIAVDGSHIYWANANDGTIMQANLDGRNATTLVTGQNLPAGVAVAP
jgi:Calx-beta domain/Domain of unknown function (DUF5050)